MTVFRNYFRILKKYIGIIIMYTAILLIFSASIILTGSSGTNSFTANKPKVAILNLDEETKITENFIQYMRTNAEIIEIENDKQKLEDALFYKDINAIIYIYDGYTEDFLQNKDKKIEVKQGTDASSSYTNMLVEKYFKVADIARSTITNEDKIVEAINQSLEKETKVEIQSTLDSASLSKASYFYNFSNYSMISICIYVVSMILFRFNEEKVKKRNLVSSKKYRSITKELFLGNLIFGIIAWLCLVALSFIMVGNSMFSMNGMFFMINSFVFMICTLTIGFLIGNIFKSSSAINGLVTVLGLGSSFITGCFIPVDFLPEVVVQFSKILPSYWYIHNNELIKTIETFNFEAIVPLLINMGIVLCFAVLFIILSNIVAKRKK